MADPLFLIPLVAAIAAGWLLGRRDLSRKRIQRFQNSFDADYFNGLHSLIDNQTDAAIDSFVKTTQQSSGVVPVRQALGVLYRRRGEVDRALLLHQQVLASPELTSTQRSQTRLLLSQDYRAAGLLDRAESLLLELVEGADSEYRLRALELLVQVYQQQKEWSQALQLVGRFPAGYRHSNSWQAHFCCELAQKALDQQDWEQLQRWLDKALKYDAGSVRASLMLARHQIYLQQWKTAVRYLYRVEQQDPAFISEAVPLLLRCHQQRPQQELLQWLMASLKRSPSAATLVAIAELMRQERGDYQTALYIAEQLKQQPSLHGFKRLIELQLGWVVDDARESLLVLSGLIGQLQQSWPCYRCVSCGFTGKVLHWLCPGCQQWGKVKPIQGLEGG